MGLVDSVLLDDWHVVAELETVARLGRWPTTLFNRKLIVEATPEGGAVARLSDSGARIASRIKYGFVWAALGEPARDIVTFPECEEADRHVVTGGSVAVHVSGLRVCENFLDMGHFPFVHTDYLGTEAKAEVAPYRVEITDENEILATDCRFFQPVASPSAEGGIDADYVYRVFRPYTVALYKSNPVQTGRKDFIALMVQPVSEERCVAHPLLAYLKDEIDARTVRWFMQLIFLQDRPILENHVPKRMPLDPKREISIVSDATSMIYRRWLRESGVRFGALRDQ